MVVDEIAEAGDRGRERGERQCTGDPGTAVSLPLVDDEVGLVHELEGEDLVAQVRAAAAVAIAPNQRCDDVLEQGVVPFLRRQNPRAPFGQPRFEQPTYPRSPRWLMIMVRWCFGMSVTRRG